MALVFYQKEILPNCIRIQKNAPATRSRISGGWHWGHLYWTGGYDVEIFNRVFQYGYQTHDIPVARHDAVNSYLIRRLRVKGLNVVEESRIEIAEGLRKPDIIAWRGNSVTTFDAQVVNEQADLDSAHRRMKRYYADNCQVVQHVKKQTDTATETVTFTSATIQWGSVCSKQSYTNLLAIGITKRDLGMITSRLLVGGHAEFSRFNRGTGVCWVGIKHGDAYRTTRKLSHGGFESCSTQTCWHLAVFFYFWDVHSPF